MRNFTKLITFFIILFFAFDGFSQFINYKSARTNNLFSEPTNWSSGSVPTANDKIKLLSNRDTLIIDGVYEIRQLVVTKIGAVVVGDGGDNDTLKINGNNGVTQIIQINNDGSRLDMNVPLVISTLPTTTTKQFVIRGPNARMFLNAPLINDNAHIVFGNNENKNNTKFYIDAPIYSTKWVLIGSNTNVWFEDDSDLSSHFNALRFMQQGQAGPAKIYVNSAEGKFKASGQNIINLNPGTELYINTPNVLGAKILVDTTSGGAFANLNLNIEAKQSNAGKIQIHGTSTLKLNVNQNVDSVNFDDQSTMSWGSGHIVLDTFTNKQIGFGSDAGGLTNDQLSQITADNYNGQIILDANGRLSQPEPTVVSLGTPYNVTASEGDTVSIKVEIANSSVTDSTAVVVSLTSGDADDVDTSISNDTVAFPPGDSNTKIYQFVVVDDTIIENQETITFSLHNASGGTTASVGADSVFTLTVLDNDEIKADLMIVGVNDPKIGKEENTIELYAVNDIPDLSKYALSVDNNGGGIDAIEYTLPDTSVAKGTLISLSRVDTDFSNYYGVDATFNAGSGLLQQTGNDAVSLYYNSVRIDVFGESTHNDSIAWLHTHTWAYRANASSPSTTFNINQWTIGLPQVDATTTNSAAATPFPLGTYKDYGTDLMIVGFVDVKGSADPDTVAAGPATGPHKGNIIELLVLNDIPDLSIYGLGTATNGSGTDSVEFAFPTGSSAAAGDYIIVGRDSTMAKTFFGVDADYIDSGGACCNFNGDDAVELFSNGTLIDVFGDQNVRPIEGDASFYKEGWVHRKDGKSLSTTFDVNDWTVNVGATTTGAIYKNATLLDPYPLASYVDAASPTSVFLQASSGSVDEDAGSFIISVQITDPDPTNATVVDLVFTGTDSTDIGNFTSETLTFPAGSTVSQNVDLTIINDILPEGTETKTFALQNVSGGFNTTIGSPNTFTLTINDDDLADFTLVYNELHIDPASSIDGDANGDGRRSPVEDEFIELVNTAATSFDLSGFYLTDSNEPNESPRHIFPPGTVVNPGQAIVVFGGGIPQSPSNFGGAIVQVASENRGGVKLNNSGQTTMIKNSSGLTVLSQEYNGTMGSANMSVTRSPDMTGAFTAHSGVAAANGALFSPGMKLDSTVFYNHTNTSVQFNINRATVRETDSIFNIGVTINGASDTASTVVTIGTTGIGNGTLGDIGGFTPQVLTFAPGSGTTQYIALSLTNDDLLEGNELIEFGILNIQGGDNATASSPGKFLLTIIDDEAILNNPIVLNEVLTDPPSDNTETTVVEGDANGDGSRDPKEDEFVEIVNTNSIPVDISGYSITDGNDVVHVFPENSILSGGGVALVFGGGTPSSDFDADIVSIANGAPGELSFQNGSATNSEKVEIIDAAGSVIAELTYSGATPYEGYSDQSLTRDPDLTGDFVLHTTTTSGDLYSPGTQNDGSPFDVGVNDPTTIQFAVKEFTLANEDGSYDLQDYNIQIAISNPSSTVATQAQVVFTASDLGSAADLNNYVGEVITFGSGSTESQNSVVKITNPNITLGTRYDFALLNVSGGTQATIGQNATFTLIVGDPGDIPLSVEKSTKGIIISPNPTSDFINVKIDNNKVLERFFVTNMSGVNVESKQVGKVVNELTIDARDFDNGLYILRLNFEGESTKVKFIKK